MSAKRKPRPSTKGSEEAQPVGSAGPAGSYDDWTVAELRKRARELGLSGYSGKKKAALVALLRDH